MPTTKKDSEQRKRAKYRIAKSHKNIANIRKDFCHKTSQQIVGKEENKIIVFEDLKTKNMTKKPAAKQSDTGQWEKNGVRAKAGLNKAILDKGWHQLEIFTKYKAHRAGKDFFKIPVHHISQEYADCSHTHHLDNRKKQDTT
jgi:putative transposase